MTLTLLLASATGWGASSAEPALQQQQQQEQPQGQPQPQGPPWTYEEAQAFNTAISQPDAAKKIQELEQFLPKYPQSALAPVVRRILAFFYLQPQSQNMDKAFQMAEAYFNSHNEKYPEAFKTIWGDLEKAGAKLPTEPMQDFQLLYTLLDAANQAAKNNKHDFDDQALKYAQQALVLVNNSAPPTMPPATWKQNEPVILATLHQTIGLIKLSRQDYDQAQAELQKAGELNANDPVTFYLQGEVLRTSKYAELRKAVEETRKKYNDLNTQLEQTNAELNQINDELGKTPDTPKNKARIDELKRKGEELNAKGKDISAQMQQLSDQIDQQVAQTDQIVDQMIRIYAKTVALSDKALQLQQTARQYLESYYKYRHQNSLEGLPDLIARMRTEKP
jgi:methyl-accepting chemotaxis protein